MRERGYVIVRFSTRVAHSPFHGKLYIIKYIIFIILLIIRKQGKFEVFLTIPFYGKITGKCGKVGKFKKVRQSEKVHIVHTRDNYMVLKQIHTWHE